ncbi:hypothetical protein E3N88_03644 [Mikania micrantha]|uniref:Uncharacterized protein n=1 Tax=Mikania micrantha TaxID=192012 RepID=A0A5N6Q9G6_9ASTR|nr:hypothetical protein E3N88_03644 [Mikania micrantha]
MAAAAAMMFTSSSSCPWRPSLISFCRPSPVQSACFPRVVVIVRAQTNRRMGKSESSEQKWVAKADVAARKCGIFATWNNAMCLQEE